MNEEEVRDKQVRYLWQEHFPQGCPPDDAKSLKCEAYRIVYNNPPTVEDFICYKLLYPTRNFTSACLACGLSLFTELDDLVKISKNIPAIKRKKKFFARGRLTEETGVILPTNKDKHTNSHMTWWIYEGQEVHNFFTVILP